LTAAFCSVTPDLEIVFSFYSFFFRAELLVNYFSLLCGGINSSLFFSVSFASFDIEEQVCLFSFCEDLVGFSFFS
jgi:hypothetical protein